MNKSTMLTLCLTFMVATISFSQKFGYCNSSILLSNIPEMKQADSELKGFQTQLQKRGQEMVKSLQDRAAELKRKEELGTISPKELKIRPLFPLMNRKYMPSWLKNAKNFFHLFSKR
jgi:Skp family chaperone for outer membrane proteins